jgi:hypothetical protein
LYGACPEATEAFCRTCELYVYAKSTTARSVSIRVASSSSA